MLELQREIGEMQQKEAAARALPAVLARRAGGVSQGSPQGAPQHVHVHEQNDTLLLAHAYWDWRAIVKDLLQLWPRIEPAQLDAGVANCHNSSMYCARLQVYQGGLYLTDYRAIFFDRHYAPSRIMPMLETLRRNPHLPDLDIVVAANDEPRVSSIPGDRSSWTKTCARWPGGTKGVLPPAMFSSTVNRGVMDLPWVDFAWFFPRRPHKLRTPPWSVLHPELLEQAAIITLTLT